MAVYKFGSKVNYFCTVHLSFALEISLLVMQKSAYLSIIFPCIKTVQMVWVFSVMFTFFRDTGRNITNDLVNLIMPSYFFYNWEGWKIEHSGLGFLLLHVLQW